MTPEQKEAFRREGWNACRKSIYAVCEDVQREADEAAKHDGEHAKGYAAGMARAAKSIARGFNSMEAIDDDHFRALAASQPAPAAELRPGDIEPHDDMERTVRIVRSAYGWTVGYDGRVMGLVAGDMGYESTHIVIDLEELRAALWLKPAADTGQAVAWIPGEPPKPWRNEWFIARLKDGDRVVLRALPEEYTYDYTTADETYLKADRIKAWMQFPDSEYLPHPAPLDAERVREAAERLLSVSDDMAKATNNGMADEAIEGMRAALRQKEGKA